jgi:hypothetical protein
MNQHPFPNCIHGVYVGGCGIDYMCHDCEMGTQEVSPNDAFVWAKRAWVRDMNAKVKDLMLLTKLHDMRTDEGQPRWTEQTSDGFSKVLNETTRICDNVAPRDLRAAMSYLAEATRWAEDADDADWIYRRYDAWVAEHDALSGEDQFANLPDHVLDGSY